MLGELPVPAEGNVWVADVPESLGRFYTLYDRQGHLPRACGNGFVPGDPPAGAADVPVRNLVFRGITFAHADRDVWRETDIGIQHDWEMIDKPDALFRLPQEEFKPGLDRTTVRRETREVLIHVPDGQDDLLQQVEYGVEGLLASFRASGHIFPGIIESTRAVRRDRRSDEHHG